MSIFVVQVPPADQWPNQQALATVFGSTPRIVLASILAFFAGEMTNSFVLAKLKVLMNGRKLWVRTIGSTIAGEFIDSLIFYPIAFLGVWDTSLVLKVLVSNYCLKVLNEIIMTPLTYKIVRFLKERENEDYYDRKTDFTPFSVDVS
jgi:hypothetical protein